MAVVSTGEEVWHLSVTGIIMNRTWVNIGITWNKPNLEDTTLPVEKLGGLEMYINQEKVGSTLLPEFTDDSKQVQYSLCTVLSATREIQEITIFTYIRPTG